MASRSPTECFRFSKPLARREFGSFSRAICHSRRNSWACLSFVWRWLATRELGRRGKPWFLRDSPGFHLIPELNPLPSEAIFDKITMSAFEGTPLNIALRDCGIDAFAIVGIAMEIGI